MRKNCSKISFKYISNCNKCQEIKYIYYKIGISRVNFLEKVQLYFFI